MAADFEDSIDSLAREIRGWANDMRSDNFLALLYTSDIVNKVMDTQLYKEGINRTRMGILSHLVTNGGTLTPTELSRRVLRSKHAITGAIDRLEQEGLVKREGPDKDRRIRKVTITRKGLNVLKKKIPLGREFGLQAMSCLDEKEAQALSHILKRLRKHMIGML